MLEVTGLSAGHGQVEVLDALDFAAEGSGRGADRLDGAGNTITMRARSA